MKKRTKKPISVTKSEFFKYGVPVATRTPDPQLRRLLLYPTELRGQLLTNHKQKIVNSQD